MNILIRDFFKDIHFDQDSNKYAKEKYLRNLKFFEKPNPIITKSPQSFCHIQLATNTTSQAWDDCAAKVQDEQDPSGNGVYLQNFRPHFSVGGSAIIANGRNLTRENWVILLEPNIFKETEPQTGKRSHRMGQQKKRDVIRIVYALSDEEVTVICQLDSYSDKVVDFIQMQICQRLIGSLKLQPRWYQTHYSEN